MSGRLEKIKSNENSDIELDDELEMEELSLDSIKSNRKKNKVLNMVIDKQPKNKKETKKTSSKSTDSINKIENIIKLEPINEPINESDDIEKINKETKKKTGRTKKVQDITQEEKKVETEKKETTKKAKKTKNKIEEKIEELVEKPKRGRKKKETTEKQQEPERDYSKEVIIKTNEERDLVEIALRERKCKVKVDNDEYDVYTNNTESYIIAKQSKLKLTCQDAYIIIEKNGDLYNFKTNQDLKLNYAATEIVKKNDVIQFCVDSLSIFVLNEDEVSIEVDEEKIIKDKLEDNKTLIISEKDNKVYLPYTREEILNISEKQKNKKVADIINENFVLSLDLYKNASKARFREGYNLMKNKEKRSKMDAMLFGTELMFDGNLHPAIITACKSVDELDIYLDCLEDNELEKFPCFKIVYKAMPATGKKIKKDKNKQ
jgi:plasmid stabilization system protein ParE